MCVTYRLDPGLSMSHAFPHLIFPLAYLNYLQGPSHHFEAVGQSQDRTPHSQSPHYQCTPCPALTHMLAPYLLTPPAEEKQASQRGSGWKKPMKPGRSVPCPDISTHAVCMQAP